MRLIMSVDLTVRVDSILRIHTSIHESTRQGMRRLLIMNLMV